MQLWLHDCERRYTIAGVDHTFKKFGDGREEREGTVLARNVETKNRWGFLGNLCWFVLFKIFYDGKCLTCIK